MDAHSLLDLARAAPASESTPARPCDPACSDAELYDILFHYRRAHTMLTRYRAGDDAALAAVTRMLDPLEAEARQRGIPLHRLPA